MAANNWELITDAALKDAVESVLSEMRNSKRSWYPRLRAHLDHVRQASKADFANRDFLEKLWEDDSVAATGMGSVKIGKALDDPEFRKWFSERITAPLPSDNDQTEAYLRQLYGEIESRLGEKCGRVARLKLNRVLCARFPEKLTTVADVGSLQFLYRAMGGKSGAHPISAHLAVKQRLETLLGPVVPDSLNGDLDRLTLPWALFDYINRESAPASVGNAEHAITPSPDGLRPLPAAFRRKGLTSIKGYFSTLLELIPSLETGLTREEFIDEIKRTNPTLKTS